MKGIILLVLVLSSQLSSGQFTNILIDSLDNPNETTVWVDPKNPQHIVAGANLNFTYVSNDGGFTWTKQSVSSSYGVWGDPCVIADTAGSWYYMHLSYPPSGSWIDRIVIQKSTDGGNTWSDGAYTGLNGDADQDKEWAVVDQETNSIYVTWTQFDTYGSSNSNDSSNILFSKSTDLGTSWSTPVRINRIAGDCLDGDNTAEGAVPAVGPDGEVYVAWSNRDTIFFDRSADGGVTWLDADIVASTQPDGWDYTVQGFQRCNGLPITKCDLSNGPNHGTIYINWSDQRNGPTNTDIFIAKSTDGGFTWSDAVRVNDDTTTKQQFMSWMDVDQVTGSIYVLFYDRRNHTNKGTEVYLAYSTDGGNTFTNVKVSETYFSPNLNVFIGDYVNLSAYDGHIIPVWTRQDGPVTSIWTAIIDLATLTEQTPHTANQFVLYQNVPNPFSENTSIEMDILESGYYSLSLYDLMGRKVADIFDNRFLPNGCQKISLDAAMYHLRESAYYYSLRKGNEFTTKELIFIGR